MLRGGGRGGGAAAAATAAASVAPLLARSCTLSQEERGGRRGAEEALARQSSSVLVPFVHLLEGAVHSASQRCVVCGDSLEMAGIRPTICDKPLCAFSYEEHSLGFSLETELMQHGAVTELLLFLYGAAVLGSPHLEHYFPSNLYRNVPAAHGAGVRTGLHRPGEEEEEADGVKELRFKDKNELCAAFRLLPALADLQVAVREGGGRALRSLLEGLHPLLYVLLRFVVSTSRAYLRELGQDGGEGGEEDAANNDALVLGDKLQTKFKQFLLQARESPNAVALSSLTPRPSSPAVRDAEEGDPISGAQAQARHLLRLARLEAEQLALHLARGAAQHERHQVHVDRRGVRQGHLPRPARRLLNRRTCAH